MMELCRAEPFCLGKPSLSVLLEMIVLLQAGTGRVDSVDDTARTEAILPPMEGRGTCQDPISIWACPRKAIDA